MAYANRNGQQPEPVVVERGTGISVEWRTPEPAPQPDTNPSS